MSSIEIQDEEIQKRINQEKDASKRDKYRALLWKNQGELGQEISRLLGVCRKTIYRWLKRYNTEGESGFSQSVSEKSVHGPEG